MKEEEEEEEAPPPRCSEQDGKLLRDLCSAQNNRRFVLLTAGCGLGTPLKTPKHFLVGLSSSLKTTPQMTRFRDAKVCNNLATDELTIT